MSLLLDARRRDMLQEMGVRVWLPQSTALALQPASPDPVTAPTRQAPEVPVAPSPSATRALPAASGPSSQAPWLRLHSAVQGCQACPLHVERSQVTLCPPAPGAQAAGAHWLVLGDPPDSEEDAQGQPFAADDGVLLERMLGALGLQRINPAPTNGVTRDAQASPAPARSAYVSNVLKCRPAPGSVAQATHLRACEQHLREELALVRPRVLLAMGRFAQQLLLADQPALASQPLGRLRGSVRHYQGIPVVFTYHPKALMRNPADKAKAWADLCLADALLQAASPPDDHAS